MKKRYNVSILRPAGNETALIEGIPSRRKRILLNAELMKLYPSVEQVGFYEKSGASGAQLEMAGGEFCGNALRSLAFLLLENNTGAMKIKSSGVDQVLSTGVRSINTAYARMPIIQTFDCINKITEDLTSVVLSGITHLITCEGSELNEDELKIRGKQILDSQGLLTTSPAAGVMFLSKENGQYSIRPVVWVRDIQTLFLETACASGTTAVGLWAAMQSKENITKLSVKQPSGMSLTIQVEKDWKGFIDATIEGPIEVIKQFTYST